MEPGSDIFEPAETRYVPCGDSDIAYQVIGSGFDLCYVPSWFSHVEARWEDRGYAHCLRRLAGFSRLICFDRRGVGASGPAPPTILSSWEQWVDDLETVLDAAGSTRAVLFASADGGHMATLFAATHPERVEALVLMHCSASLRAREPDHLFGMPGEAVDEFVQQVESTWGTGSLIDSFFPSHAGDARFAEWWARYQRRSGSPRMAASMARAAIEMDMRAVLPAVKVPTLVLHRAGFPFTPLAHSRYLVEHIPNAELTILEGADGTVYTGDIDAAVDSIEHWLTGTETAENVDELFAAILVTDIVSSTDRARAAGDRAWTTLLDAHDRAVATAVKYHEGRVVNSTGDGVVALFRRPSAAVQAAVAIQDAVRPLDLAVRAGVHAGLVTLHGDNVAGLAVHCAARVAARAGADQVLVSSVVVDVTDSTAIRFRDAGVHDLKGLDGEWRLFETRLHAAA